jgi:glutamate/aspartate transport system permease protein
MAWDWQVFCRTRSTTIGRRCFGNGGGKGTQTYLDWMISAWGWTLLVAGCAWWWRWWSAPSSASCAPAQQPLAGRASQCLGGVVPQHPAAGADLPLVPRGAGASRLRSRRPSFVLVVFALGFFTSARIAEQVRAGVQALPRGQRYAGMAMGFTTPQTYRYVLLPMAFRIIIPPLTSESMNIFKNSSVAFAVSIAELTIFAMQAGRKPRAASRSTWP